MREASFVAWNGPSKKCQLCWPKLRHLWTLVRFAPRVMTRPICMPLFQRISWSVINYSPLGQNVVDVPLNRLGQLYRLHRHEQSLWDIWSGHTCMRIGCKLELSFLLIVYKEREKKRETFRYETFEIYKAYIDQNRIPVPMNRYKYHIIKYSIVSSRTQYWHFVFENLWCSFFPVDRQVHVLYIFNGRPCPFPLIPYMRCWVYLRMHMCMQTGRAGLAMH